MLSTPDVSLLCKWQAATYIENCNAYLKALRQSTLRARYKGYNWGGGGGGGGGLY